MTKVKIKFLTNVVVDDCFKDTRQEEAYRAGKTYSLPERSANHWLARGVAEIRAIKTAQPAVESDDGPAADGEPGNESGTITGNTDS